jgi:hypothetical protein
MSRSIDEVVTAICRLPLDYKEIGSASAVTLVERSGYLPRRADVTTGRLAAALAEHPDWIQAWFDWSDDKRTDRGWYLVEAGPMEFWVGYIHLGASLRSEPLRFDDKGRACAVFIRHEVGQIARHAR